ncbi:MAG: hypothetical protein L0332_17150 [Chloroflexi bacterium]|nr:hypothetical protein [Chloroflexota bacterium]MCI0728427.1 hypothetical protein [Chloroflexota bacterium]
MPSRRTTVFAFVIILLVLIVSSSGVSAGWAQCRSDPLVILSNGLVLDLSADIGVFLWNVQNVDYVLHVPEGVTLVASISTPAWPTTLETFTLYSDNPPGEYHSITTVYTNQGNATVTAHTVLLSALGLQLDAVSVPGVEQQALYAYLNTP